jgi:hypothetical protein
MYSGKYLPQENYTFYEIRYNRDRVLNSNHTWNAFEKMMLTEPLGHYIYVVNNGGVDPWQNYLESYWAVRHPAVRGLVHKLYNGPGQYAAYPGWLRKYVSRVEGVPVEEIIILKKQVKFENNGELTELRSDTAMVIK